MNDILMISFKVSLAIFMASSLLDMGLRLNLSDAIRGLRNIRFVAHTLVWSFVICPALAFLITPDRFQVFELPVSREELANRVVKAPMLSCCYDG